jgi:hypothetical protein
MLADTVLLPTSGQPQVLGKQFDRYRLANAFAWLDDLGARLPARSAAAVRASLRGWEQWVAGRRCRDGTIDPAQVDKRVIRAPGGRCAGVRYVRVLCDAARFA